MEQRLSPNADIGGEEAFFKKMLSQKVAIRSTRPAVRMGAVQQLWIETIAKIERGPHKCSNATANRGSFNESRPPSWPTSSNGSMPQS